MKIIFPVQNLSKWNRRQRVLFLLTFNEFPRPLVPERLGKGQIFPFSGYGGKKKNSSKASVNKALFHMQIGSLNEKEALFYKQRDNILEKGYE